MKTVAQGFETRIREQEEAWLSPLGVQQSSTLGTDDAAAGFALAGSREEPSDE